jgi:hypothetical protein
MNSEEIQRVARFLLSSGVKEAEILSKLKGLQTFRVLPSFVLCSRQLPHLYDSDWSVRLYEANFNEYKENYHHKLNFDYLRIKKQVCYGISQEEKRLEILTCFNQTFITELQSLSSMSRGDGKNLTEKSSSFFRLSASKEKELLLEIPFGAPVGTDGKRPEKVVWGNADKIIIQPNGSRLELYEKSKNTRKFKVSCSYQFEFDGLSDYDPKNTNNIFFVCVNDQTKEIILTSIFTEDLNISYHQKLQVFHSSNLIIMGFQVTKEEIIVMTHSAIYFYQRNDKESSLLHKQVIHYQLNFVKQPVSVSLISENLINFEFNGDHHLYLKEGDNWILFQTLHFQGKDDHVIQVPHSYSFLTNKAKSLPLEVILPLDLVVDMITFLY